MSLAACGILQIQPPQPSKRPGTTRVPGPSCLCETRVLSGAHPANPECRAMPGRGNDCGIGIGTAAEDLAKPVIALASGGPAARRSLVWHRLPDRWADHVVDNVRGAAVSPSSATRSRGSGRLQAWPDVDLALLEVLNPRAKAKPAPHWRLGVIPMLDAVQTLGYPYGLNREKLALTVRGFGGHVVSAVPFDRLP